MWDCLPVHVNKFISQIISPISDLQKYHYVWNHTELPVLYAFPFVYCNYTRVSARIYVQNLPRIMTALCDYYKSSGKHCDKVSDHACAICIINCVTWIIFSDNIPFLKLPLASLLQLKLLKVKLTCIPSLMFLSDLFVYFCYCSLIRQHNSTDCDIFMCNRLRHQAWQIQ